MNASTPDLITSVSHTGDMAVRVSPAEFYEAHAARVYAYFKRRVGDATAAEDLTSETFERLAAAWADFEPAGSGDRPTRVWVYRVAGNVLRNAWRGQSRLEARHRTWFAEQPVASDPARDIERRVVLEGALSVLSPADQDLLGLRFWEELSAPEIAAVLDLPPREVYTRVERCLRTLKRELASELEVNHVGS